jgi:hypothetical protein
LLPYCPQAYGAPIRMYSVERPTSAGMSAGQGGGGGPAGPSLGGGDAARAAGTPAAALQPLKHHWGGRAGVRLGYGQGTWRAHGRVEASVSAKRAHCVHACRGPNPPASLAASALPPYPTQSRGTCLDTASFIALQRVIPPTPRPQPRGTWSRSRPAAPLWAAACPSASSTQKTSRRSRPRPATSRCCTTATRGTVRGKRPHTQLHTLSRILGAGCCGASLLLWRGCGPIRKCARVAASGPPC